MEIRVKASSWWRTGVALTVFGLLLAVLTGCDGTPPENYELEEIASNSFPAKGIHGLAVTSDGKLLVGSVVGQSIYEVEPDGSDWKVFQAPTIGEADDIAIAPNGTIAWTSFLQGNVVAKRPGRDPVIIAEGLPGTNSLAFRRDGRLFMTQVFLGDALYELDPSGLRPPRELKTDLGGLNGFDFGADGYLYGPLWFKKKIVRIDVNRPRVIEEIADIRGIPAAVNFGKDGRLFAVDTELGQLLEVHPPSGEQRVLAELDPALDNLAVDPRDGTIFVTNMSENSITKIDPDTGEKIQIIGGGLAVAGDIASYDDGIIVADVFGVVIVTEDGEVIRLKRVFGSDVDYPTHVGTKDDKILLTGATSGAVQLLDEDGETLGLIHGEPTPHDGLPLKGSGAIWLRYVEGSIVRATKDDLSDPTVWVSGLDRPSSIVAGDRKDYWVAEYGSGRILKIKRDGEVRPLYVGGDDFGELFTLKGIEALEFGDDDYLYATQSPGTVWRIDTELGVSSIVYEGELEAEQDIPTSELAGPGIPIGIATLPDGDLAVSSNGDVAIYRMVDAGE